MDHLLTVIATLLSSDGQHLITDPNKILEPDDEHMNSVLNCPSSISDVAIDSLPQQPILEDLAHPPTKIEVTRTINEISSEKAPGNDGISSEVFKCGGANLLT